MPREKQFDEEQAIRCFTAVFWQKGYNACSVGDLVAASGLSRSSMYDTFGDKEQLFIRCLSDYSNGIKRELEAVTTNKQTAIEKIEAALMMPFQLQQGASCKGCLAVNTIGELEGISPEILSIIMKTRAGWEDFVAGCIEEGQKNGEIGHTDQPQALAKLLYTAFCGLLVLQKTAGHQDELTGQISLLIKILKG